MSEVHARLSHRDRTIVAAYLDARALELRASAQRSDNAASYADSSQARLADARDANDYRQRAAILTDELRILLSTSA